MRGPAHSPACGDRPEARILGAPEQGTERSDRGSFGPRGVQCHHAPSGVLQGHFERTLGHLEARVAHDVRRDADRDPEVAPAGLEAVQHGFDRPEPVVAQAWRVVARGEHDLGVPNAVAHLVLAELVGDPPEVLGLGQQGTGGDVLRDEVVEVREPPSAAGEAGRHGGTGEVGQLLDGRDPDRTLQMDVQLCLREEREVSHAADGSGRGDRCPRAR